MFVDVQDKSGFNRNLIRRHAAEDAHRKKRLTDVFRYQNQIGRQKTLPLRPAKKKPELKQNHTSIEDETDKELLPIRNPAPSRRARPPRGRQRDRRRDPKTALTFRWRVGNPTAFRPPTDDLKIEFVLNESFNWMIGQYTSSWSSSVQRNPNVFDLNGEVEILREAFYVVTDLLEIQKTAAAFAVLKHTLDAMPAIFQDPHPELLFTLVELAYGINMTGATDLHAKVRPHVAELASTIMGTRHPLTILLKSKFDVALQTHVTELVFKCIVDTMSKTFGKVAYQTLVQQMGRSQFYARTGRGIEGQKLIAEVEEQWRWQYGTDSALARLAELELCLMRLQDCHSSEPALEAQANNAMLRIEVMAGVYSSKFTDQPSNRYQVGAQFRPGMALAHWFLQNKRYTFALHCYERAKRMRVNDMAGQSSQRPLADLIADTVTSALSDVLRRPGDLSILPSQAPTEQSVLAMA
jgi:hypothetical protein